MKALVPLALLLAGCVPTTQGGPPYMHLLDQRSFAGSGQAPTAMPALPPLPLATIRFTQPDIDFAPALAQAVEEALARKPDAAFDVITPLPKGAAPDARSEDEAAQVARSIAEQGVQPDRIHIGLVEDPGAATHEVRVYVR
jgi:hypothetical protein